jgi:hypothetical protein
LFAGISPRGTPDLIMMLTRHSEMMHFGPLVHQVVDGKAYSGIAIEEAGGPAMSPVASSPAREPRVDRVRRGRCVVTQDRDDQRAELGALGRRHPGDGADRAGELSAQGGIEGQLHPRTARG